MGVPQLPGCPVFRSRIDRQGRWCTGGIAGLVIGVIVTYGVIPAFVVTPGMMAIARSAGLY
jgi:ABC-type xylose transport system permease subunit